MDELRIFKIVVPLGEAGGIRSSSATKQGQVNSMNEDGLSLAFTDSLGIPQIFLTSTVDH
jgi:hypothetical protein